MPVVFAVIRRAASYEFSRSLGMVFHRMGWLASLATLATLLAGAGSGWAEDCAQLTASTPRLSLSPFLSTYRDASGALTLDQARQAFREGRFQPGRKP